jgi:anion transporter
MATENAAGERSWGGGVGSIGLAVAAGVAALLAPPVHADLPLAGQRALVVTLVAIVLWTLDLVPSGATALLTVALLALTGAASTSAAALSGFASPVPYFLIGVLGMGAAVVRSGLAERVARALLEGARGRGIAVYGHLVASLPVLTFVLPSATTRSGIMIHVYDELFTLAGVGRGEPAARGVMLALASINRLASTALLTGGITPVMSAALIGGMSWTGWFVLMAVPYYVLLALGAGLVWALHRRAFARPLALPAPQPRRPLTALEGRTTAVLAGASVLWLTDGVHRLDPAIPAVLALVVLLVPGFGPLAWADLDRHVGWSNFFVLGASISLARALESGGAAAWLAEMFVGGATSVADRPLLTLVGLMGGATLLRAIVPGIGGFLALGLPLAMSVGRETGLDPLVCALTVMMTGDAVIYYPAQSASALVIHERGHVTTLQLLRFGLWMTLLAWLTVLLAAVPWWALVGHPLTPSP